MAKTNDLPSVDGTLHKTLPTATAEVRCDTESVMAIATEGYVPRRVEARLTRAQAVKLRDKLRILQDSGAQTADGRFVSNRAQAMQWIIENEVVV